MRQIAAEVLLDGEFHPRPELVGAIRAAGLPNPHNIDNALAGDAFISSTENGSKRFALDPWILEEIRDNGGRIADERLRNGGSLRDMFPDEVGAPAQSSNGVRS